MRPSRFSRWPRAAGVIAALAAGAILASPGVAAAHARLVRSTPSAGTTVTHAPSRVSLAFDEAVTLIPRALAVTTDLGVPVATDAAVLRDHGRLLTARLQDHLGAGGYAVAWRVQADDGHIESGSFRFGVAGARGRAGRVAGAGRPGPPSMPAQPVWPVLVAAAIALAAGVGAGIVVRRGLRVVAAGSEPYAVRPWHEPGSPPPQRQGASRFSP